MTLPCDLDAVEAKRRIDTGDLSPVELLQSCLDRIEDTNGALNAITAMDVPRAEREAQLAEEVVRSGEELGPLGGLPIGIKDLNITEGLRTTFGSLLHADNVPDADEALVARLRDAGAIVLAKTNTPEFGAGSSTTNKVFGPTKNPYDLERTSGGSSGGSAAAVAAGMLPMAHGSDTFGSLRNPATWCGVVGFRPTPGLVARETRTLAYTHFSVQGPMARNVRDAALMMTGLAGFDPRDPMSGLCDPSQFLGTNPTDLSSLKVAWTTDFDGEAPMDDGIAKTFEGAVGKLTNTFGAFDEASPALPGVRDILWTLRCVYFLANHEERARDHADLLSPNIIANVEAGRAMSLEDVARAERGWAHLYAEFQRFFADIDLLVIPGNAVSAFRLEDGIPKSVGGRVMENYVDASLVRSIITLSGHPVVAIPTGLDHLGLPFGVQVVGPRHGDKFLLDAAASLEDHLSTLPGLEHPRPDLEKLTS